jgi:hypothetical protein
MSGSVSEVAGSGSNPAKLEPLDPKPVDPKPAEPGSAESEPGEP